MGRLGQKSGAGWYAYVDGKKHIDPFVTDLIEKIAREKGLARKTIPADAIQRYVHAAIVNEGAKILSEGIAPRPIDIDVVLIHGYGFPAWRGGPIFAADRIGLDRILSDILEVQSFAGVGFEPAPLVERLAAEGGTFGDLEPGEAAHAN
jgi:3-hydroxyacyl-CoA dehydrogenase